MAYVRINSAVEYDPASNLIRQDGQTRPAGLAALGFSTILDVQQQLRGEAPQPAPAAAAAPAPPAHGQLTASGAPLIQLATTPAANPWEYTGPAARNPYYITPGTVMQEGLVPGYENWFETTPVLQPGATAGSSSVAYTMRVPTEEGAQEALRLVQEYVPEATVEATVFGAGGGPWCAGKPSYYVVLPSGSRLNAAALLDSYYNHGQGVTALSDLVLRDELRWQTGRSDLGNA
jgi:hypothetical protein